MTKAASRSLFRFAHAVASAVRPRLRERLAQLHSGKLARLANIGVPELLRGEPIDKGDGFALDLEQVGVAHGACLQCPYRQQSISLVSAGEAEEEGVGFGGGIGGQHPDISIRVAEAEAFIRRWHRDDGENDLSTLMLRASSANERIPMGSLDIWSRRHALRPDIFPRPSAEVAR